MNLFILDNDIKKCAQYHCDKHVVKIITEANQMLCSALHVLTNKKNIPYKITHLNHPCTKWVRESKENFLWTIEYTQELCNEYNYRYNKIHKGQYVLDYIKKNIPKNFDKKELTKFVLAMPEKYKSDDSVNSYRQYYIGEKQHIATWKKREVPFWFIKI